MAQRVQGIVKTQGFQILLSTTCPHPMFQGPSYPFHIKALTAYEIWGGCISILLCNLTLTLRSWAWFTAGSASADNSGGSVMGKAFWFAYFALNLWCRRLSLPTTRLLKLPLVPYLSSFSKFVTGNIPSHLATAEVLSNCDSAACQAITLLPSYSGNHF